MFEIDTFYGCTISDNFKNYNNYNVCRWFPNRYIKINNIIYNFPHISINYGNYLKQMVNSTTINENVKDNYLNKLHKYEKEVKCYKCIKNFIKCNNEDNLNLIDLNCSKFKGELYKSKFDNTIYFKGNAENLDIDYKKSSEFIEKLNLKYFKEPK